MGLVILLVVLVLLFGGGGFYYGPPYHYYGGGLGLVLLIIVIPVVQRKGVIQRIAAQRSLAASFCQKSYKAGRPTHLLSRPLCRLGAAPLETRWAEIPPR
jgi:hypothetical protein